MSDLIGLYTPDKTWFPNYALMKLYRYHNERGDIPILFDDPADDTFDKVYCSSVFSFTQKVEVPAHWVTGGSGYSLQLWLPDTVEDLEPDYSMYPDMTHALGFLTRGCIRNCDFCIVREKEGKIRAYRDAETVAQGRRDIVLCDNNVLAHPHGLEQMEAIADKQFKVDFNQGMDARLITDEIAKLMSRMKWLSPVRMACDGDDMIEPVVRAIELLRWYNVTPRAYFVYVLAKDVESVLRRVRVLKGMNVTPFVQPYIDKVGTPPSRELRRLARWVNAGGGKAFKTCSWENYCKERGERI
jgi:hypothetical protein